jgi:hypothetical protein
MAGGLLQNNESNATITIDRQKIRGAAQPAPLNQLAYSDDCEWIRKIGKIATSGHTSYP